VEDLAPPPKVAQPNHEQGGSDDEKMQERRARIAVYRPHFQGPRQSAFSNLVERAVDGLQGKHENGAYEDAQRILANIRKQYDEVHAEAERKETELMDIRKEVRLSEADEKPDRRDQALSYTNITKDELAKQIAEVNNKIEESTTTKKVYSHMVDRLKREQKIVQEKVKSMEEHLDRKTREVEKRQEMSRRVHNEKVKSILELEAMEQDLEQEKNICNTALDDLETVLQQRRNEVRRREDFERWRYEVAMEAASEAFYAMAGRFRKIYAIEKLTGNCLQKIIFEQAEQSQTTEDGFQKIREVTGLTDVMDIVHKFLNRDVEHEQLRNSVREAETRLHELREAERNRNCETVIGCNDAGTIFRKRGLNREVAVQEQSLSRAQRDHDDCQIKLRNTTLLMENIMQWARKVAKSLSSFEELDELEGPQDIVEFFKSLSQTIDRFLTWANEEYSSSKLSKLTSQACSREYMEQQKLLTDKDFIRANCRIPATLDGQHAAGKHKHGHHSHGHSHHSHGHRMGNDEERHDVELAEERERLKHASRANVQEREKMRLNQLSKGERRSDHREGKPRRLEDESGEHRSEHGEETRSTGKESSPRGKESSPRGKRNTFLDTSKNQNSEKSALPKSTTGRLATQTSKRPASGKRENRDASDRQAVGSSGRPASGFASRGREIRGSHNIASRDSSPG
jgi:hypothetical protein